MASMLIRRTGGTDIPADALADWLEPRLSRPDNNVRVRALRLASVEHVDEFGGHPAGWLVEPGVADGDLAHAGYFVTPSLGDMRLLGLRPAVFIASGAATAPSPHGDERSRAAATRSGGP
jgi:hypothetical protein